MKAIRHCHAHGVHSIVLDAGPPMRRLFIADTDHMAWTNLGGWFYPMSVGFHRHRTDITLVPIFGEVINVLAHVTGDDPIGYFACDYRSQIVDGESAVVWTGRRVGLALDRRPLTSVHPMPAAELHTVYVPRGRQAAWIVQEGEPSPDVDLTVYTNTTSFNAAGLYQEMPGDEAEQWLRRFGLESRA